MNVVERALPLALLVAIALWAGGLVVSVAQDLRAPANCASIDNIMLLPVSDKNGVFAGFDKQGTLCVYAPETNEWQKFDPRMVGQTPSQISPNASTTSTK